MKFTLRFPVFALLFIAWVGPWSRLVAASTTLHPGDVALTRVKAEAITLLALRDIEPGTELYLSKRVLSLKGWEIEDDTLVPGLLVWKIGEGGIPAGTQKIFRFPVAATGQGFQLNWGDTLYLFTEGEKSPRFLYAVTLERNWRRWDTLPEGLEEGFTALLLGQFGTRTAIDFSFAPTLLWKSTALRDTAANLLTLLAEPHKSWAYGPEADAAGAVEQVAITLVSSPGIVRFAASSFTAKAGSETVEVLVQRLLGSDDLGAEVEIAIETERPGLSEWKSQKVGTGDALTALIRHEETLIATTRGGSIFTSSDGLEWKRVFSLKGEWHDAIAISHLNQPHLLAVGYSTETDGPVAASSSDGENWKITTIPAKGRFRCVAWYQNLFYAGGHDGLLYSGTVNDVWTQRQPPLKADFDTAAASSDLLLLAGPNGSLWSFRNGQWSQHLAEAEGITYEDAVYSSGMGYFVAGRAGQCAYSADGTSWTLFQSPFKEDFRSVSPQGTAVLVGGANGLIASYQPISLTSSDPSSPGHWQIHRQPDRSAAPVLDLLIQRNQAFAGTGDGLLLTSSLDGKPTTAEANSDFLPFEADEGRVTWEPGELGLQRVQVSIPGNTATAAFARKSFPLQMVARTNGLAVGRDRARVILLHRDTARKETLSLGYGALVRLVEVTMDTPVIATETSYTPPTLRCRLWNTSDYPSVGGFLRFEGSNLPDYPLDVLFPTGLPAGQISPPGSQPALQIPLDGTVRAVSYYETIANGEEVFQHRVYLNSIWTPPGAVQDYDGSVEFKDISTTGSGTTLQKHGWKPHDGSGWVWYPPPDGTGGEGNYGIYLQAVTIEGAGSLEVGASASFSAIGTFYDPLLKESFQEQVVASWATSIGGASVEPASGRWSSGDRPDQQYPLRGPLSVSSTDGAPVDLQGIPIPITAELPVELQKTGGLAWTGEVARYGLAGTPGTEPADDYDGDGWSNLFEYALGLDWRTPQTEWPEGLSLPLDAPTSQQLSFTRPQGLAGVRYSLQVSADLLNWTELPLQYDPQSPSGWERWFTDQARQEMQFARLHLLAY